MIKTMRKKPYCKPEENMNATQDQERIDRVIAYGRGHAVWFPNGAATSEECDHEYDRSEHDEQDRRGHNAVLIADILQVGDLGQRNASDYHQCNTA